jgi:hypothetical protein
VDWRFLPVLVALPAVAALALGWLLRTLFVFGWYLLFLAPIIAGLLLAGVVVITVGFTRCRNRWLGAGVGILSGLLLYLSYYQFCLIDVLPAGMAHRVDLLPHYIWLRLQSDVAVDAAAGARGGEKPVLVLNILQFSFEVLAVLGVVTAAAWKRSGRAYCEELGQWMERKQALLPTGFTPDFIDALEHGGLEDFLDTMPQEGDPTTSGRLVLEYVPDGFGPVLSFPVYVSAEDFDPSRLLPPLRRVRRTTVRQVELQPSEVLELRPVFPELARLLETQDPRLRDKPGDVVAPAEPVPLAGEVAQVTAVPEPYRRRVRRPGYALSVNLRGAIPLVFLFGGGSLIAAAVWLMQNEQVVPGCAVLVAGIPCLAWGLYTPLLCSGVYTNRWIRRRLCEEIAQRPDVLIRHDDPDAAYVSLIPRDSFVTIKATMSSDLLLLKIDRPHRQILMEGDSDRYRIPAGAVEDCKPQMFFHPMDAQHRTEIWMARLVVRFEQGSRELLISTGTTRFTPTTNDRRHQRAEDLCQQIRKLSAAKG